MLVNATPASTPLPIVPHAVAPLAEPAPIPDAGNLLLGDDIFAWPGSRSDAVRTTTALVHWLHLRATRPSDPAQSLAEGLARALHATTARVGDVVRGVSGPAAFAERAGQGHPAPLHPDADALLAHALQIPATTVTLRRADAPLPQPLALADAPRGMDLLVSLFRTADKAETAILLERGPAAPRFTEQERDTLHAIHATIGAWAWERIQNAEAAAAAAPPALATTTPDARAFLARLTPAQLGVLPYLLDGLRESEIGKLIFRSRYTVHDHARAIYAAFGVSNRVGLVLACTRAGITPAGLRAAAAAAAQEAAEPAPPTLQIRPLPSVMVARVGAS